MASSLTYQLRQHQQVDKNVEVNLPSPPNSSCGEDITPPPVLTSSTTSATDSNNSSLPAQEQLQQRRDSLQSHFSTLTLQAISNSLPENYTIDHSSIKASLQQALATTVAAKTAAAAAAAAAVTSTDTSNSVNRANSPNSSVNISPPIPIEFSPLRRNSVRSESPHLSPASVAAATGGLTIRHRRPSTVERKLGSPKPHHHYHFNKASTSLPTAGYHRCEDCGKVYKHPSCLTKHRWEHSEEWELTSKLLLTKHQQVQMLEAAAILVSMDNNKHSSTSSSTSSSSSSSSYQREDQSDNDMDQDEEVVDILNDDDTGHEFINSNHDFVGIKREDNDGGIDDNDNDDDDDDDDDDDESIHVDDDDDDDISIEMDQDDTVMDQDLTFPLMVGSTPTMLPVSFATNTV